MHADALRYGFSNDGPHVGVPRYDSAVGTERSETEEVSRAAQCCQRLPNTVLPAFGGFLTTAYAQQRLALVSVEIVVNPWSLGMC